MVTSTEVAKRITNSILDKANLGEQCTRDYLRTNLEFTNLVVEEIPDILFRPKCG
jgi:hypothetical protein